MSAPRHFNDPGEMLARFVYLAHLLLLGCGILLGLASSVHQRSGFLLKAAGMIAVAGGLRWALVRQRRFDAPSRSFNTIFSSKETGIDSPDERRFAALLEKHRVIESVRGTPAFDPWALLSLQREIDQCLREHPEFSELLDESQSSGE